MRIGEPGAGVVIGSGGGGIDVGERQYYDFFVERGRKVTPYAIPVSIVGMMSSEISISLRLRGVSHVLSCGCTSSTDAIGYAAALIRSGEADVLLSGGADACVTPGMIFGFSRMRVVSTAYNDRPAAASRPFDRGRDGFVLGEGAWMVVLEREDRARARGASDLRVDRRLRLDLRRLSPRADGARRRGDRPRDARWRSSAPAATGESIGYVSYHGTSTVLNDAVESRCVRQVFGAHADRLAGLVGQVDDRPPAGRQRRGRHRHRRARDARAASCRRRSTRPIPIRPATSTTSRTTGGPATIEAALCNCLGFGSKNSAIVIGVLQNRLIDHRRSSDRSIGHACHQLIDHELSDG